MKKILCVEDDVTQQIILETVLMKIERNLKIDWVGNALKAFEKLKNPYDLLLVDIFLDGKLTGIDLRNVCRNVYPKLPVVIISSLPYQKLSDFSAAEDQSFYYIQKPIDVREFQKLVKGLLFSDLTTQNLHGATE